MERTEEKLELKGEGLGEFFSAVGRRHHGRTLPEGMLTHFTEKMQQAYTLYKKARLKRDNLLDVEWDVYRIEQNYGTSLFVNAHRRLKRYEKAMQDHAQTMFSTLLMADGNTAGGTKYSPFWCISPDEIAADFSSKYKQIT